MGRQDYRNRRATRSRQHEYDRAGAYFVTICSVDREPLFGTIADGVILLDRSGRIVELCWQRLPQRFRSVSVDAFVVMPNHVHGIIVLGDSVPVTPLPKIVGAFKSDSARRINNIRGGRGVPVWQRSFHDQIIRENRHLEHVRAYITANPTNWPYDQENPIVNQ